MSVAQHYKANAFWLVVGIALALGGITLIAWLLGASLANLAVLIVVLTLVIGLAYIS